MNAQPDTPGYENILTFSRAEKTVPYAGSGMPRAEGGANFGFANLKLEPGRIEMIPELVADPALRALVVAINHPDTGLFSTACLSALREGPGGVQASGYIEFALNCAQAVTDPVNYFTLFFQFERQLRESRFGQPVAYQWELCPTRFLDVGVDGYAVDVSVITGHLADRARAAACWTAALAPLETLLSAVPARAGHAIYARQRA